ncbi:MAG: hypothetical protein K0S81_1355 [Rhodospirillales bacterium]|jgi:hypothetical protein|nr:hypothetical protein [Rhodospirillales bacterium]
MAAPLKPWQRRMRLAGWTIIALFGAGVAGLALKLSYDVATYVDEPELMEPGQSYGVADYIISEVLFTAADLKFYAYRFGPEQPFRIVVLRPGQDGVEECAAGEAFDRWFIQVTDMYHGAALEYPVANEPGDWAVFELIKYETPVEENDMRMLLPTRPGEPIVVEWAHIPGQYPSEWDPELFARVKQGCAGLGANG